MMSQSLDVDLSEGTQAAVAPFESFPSLPRLLRRYLAERGRTLDAIAQEVCAAHDSVWWFGATSLEFDGEGFCARDDFHASPFGYRRWAEARDRTLAG